MSDDIEDDDLDLGGENFDSFEKKPGTLGALWRDNPVFKVGTIVGAVVLIFGTIFFMGGSEEIVDPSYVPAGSEITAPPGTQEASPAYIEAVEEENQARLEEAVKEGGSALPTPIDPPVGRLTILDEETEEEDPLQRWRKLQEERLERELQRTQSVKPEYADAAQRNEAVQAMAGLMSEQMQAVLESKPKVNLEYLGMTGPSWLEDLREQEEAEAEAVAAALADGTEDSIEITLLPAAEIAYAQLLTEANSDLEGPVLALIVSGPLSGSRALGDFELNEEAELLTLNFHTVVYKGESIGIDAIALDPDTTLPGMATEVDHRYFTRVVMPMAAAFIEGAAEAISESGRTTISIEGETVTESTDDADSREEIASGIEEAGQELGEILDEIGDETEILVRIAAGTPLGILFLEPVVRTVENQELGSTGTTR